MNSTPSASPASYTGMMCGSSTAAAARDSRMNRCLNPSSAASCGASTFSATSRPQPLVPCPEHHRHPACAQPIF